MALKYKHLRSEHNIPPFHGYILALRWHL